MKDFFKYLIFGQKKLLDFMLYPQFYNFQIILIFFILLEKNFIFRVFIKIQYINEFTFKNRRLNKKKKQL